MDSVPRSAERRPVGVPTALAALVVLAFVALLGWSHLTTWRLDDMADADAALALSLVVGRTLDLDEAVARATAWERRLYRLILSDRAEDLAEGIRWFDELARYSLDPGVDLHLAILEGESGRLASVRRRVLEWERRDEPFPALAGLVATAYLDAPDGEPGATVAAEVGPLLLPPGWFRDRLAIRLAERAGNDELAKEVDGALAARATRLLGRVRRFTATEAVVLAAGLVVLVAGVVARLARPRPGGGGAGRLRLGPAVLPPPWPGRGGAVALIHGGALGALLLVSLQLLALASPERPLTGVAVAMAANLALVPLLVIAHRRLLRPAGLGLGAGLGLVPRRSATKPFLAVLLGLVLLGQAGEWALGWAAGALGISSHWTEWFDRDLVWGEPLTVALGLADAVLLAPVAEEILFRGLLFATLRARLGLGASAVLSAAIFAAAHGYGAVGLAVVFWSGLLWAVAYEKTGSLLPAIAAHGVDNLGASLALILVLRA